MLSILICSYWPFVFQVPGWEWPHRVTGVARWQNWSHLPLVCAASISVWSYISNSSWILNAAYHLEPVDFCTSGSRTYFTTAPSQNRKTGDILRNLSYALWLIWNPSVPTCAPPLPPSMFLSWKYFLCFLSSPSQRPILCKARSFINSRGDNLATRKCYMGMFICVRETASLEGKLILPKLFFWF